ncbi:MAG: hypothetical protein MZV63_52995 [Marinilabiliales bacterium]|nr:hypothetical protein [Marinilabiliales bacterium]
MPFLREALQAGQILRIPASSSLVAQEEGSCLPLLAGLATRLLPGAAAGPQKAQEPAAEVKKEPEPKPQPETASKECCNHTSACCISPEHHTCKGTTSQTGTA